MYAAGPPPLDGHSVIPPCVAAAQEYLRFAEQLRNPPPAFDGQRTDTSRDLTPKERVVYDAALEVLRLYFSGEKDYAATISGSMPPSDEDPKSRVPEPV